MYGRGNNRGHRAGHSYSGSIGQKAQLTNAYQELGKELSSTQIKTVGNYTLGRVIGEGSFGKVRLAVNKLTSQRCAIKQIPRSCATPLLTREIHHHRRLHHASVLQLYEVIATEGHIWLVSELCAGGELFDYLVEKGRLGEYEARRMFGQLCLGVGYIHSQGVVHRDLKLENILLDERLNIKIADFGFGREFEQRRLMETFCGTTGYAAPEMLAGKKYTGEEVDVWSLGVILYTLLTGSLPFDDDDEEIMKQKIQAGDYDLPTWLSEDSRNLISGILRLEPRDRLSIKQILGHEWFCRPFVASPAPMDYFQFMDLAPEPIPEESNSPSAGSHTEGDTKQLEPSHEQDPSTASSVASTSSWHSAASTNESDIGLGIRGSRSGTPLTSDESEEANDSPGSLDKVKGVNREGDDFVAPQYSRIPRNASQITITRSDSRRSATNMHRYSPLPPSQGESPAQSFRFPPPSPATLDSLPHGSPALPIPAHSRTPSRTKRRSVGSIMSERMVPHNDMLALPDFLGLLSAPAFSHFASPMEKQLLDSLALLGFDTGQMMHSIRTDACDASGAIWWQLKLKAEQREIEAQDSASIGPTKSHSASSLHKQAWDRKSERNAESGDEAYKTSSEMPRVEELQISSFEESQPVQVQRTQPTPSPPAEKTFTTSTEEDSVVYGGPAHTPSPRKPRLAGFADLRMSSASAPMLSPSLKAKAQVGMTPPLVDTNVFASLGSKQGSPVSPAMAMDGRQSLSHHEIPKVTRPTTKARSASVSTVSMLQRATSALGAAVGKKDRSDESELGLGSEGRSTPNLLSGGLFGRKVSTGTLLEKPPLNERRSSDKLSSQASNASEAVPQNSGPSTPELNNRSTPSFGRSAANSPAPTPSLENPSTHSTLSKEDIGSYGMPETASPEPSSSSLRASVISNSSASVSKANRGSKNLFSSLKFWLNDERKKNKRQRQSSASLAHTATGLSPRPIPGNIRQPHPHIYAPSPLQRPPIARMPSNTPSSTGVSRRNSSTSARRYNPNEQPSPLLGHTRRRSDASRKSFSSIQGARTPVEDRDPTRPPSSQSQSGAIASAELYNAARKRHARASSTSSAGSRQSTMISGSPIATYRRTPAVTQVRRLSTPKNRHSFHSRNHSNPSSVHSGSSRRSSMSGNEAGATIIEEENENMEESVVSLERDRALRKLSGAGLPEEDEVQLSQTPLTTEAVDTVDQVRPIPMERRQSSESSKQRGRQSQISARGHARHGSSSSVHGTAVFAAHRVVNPFGTPNGSHLTQIASQRSGKEVQRAKLRDVFKNKKPDGEDGWVDEDEGLDSYSGGFGQSTSRSSMLNPPSGSAFNGPSPAESTTTGPDGLASGSGSIFGEGRYAGLGMSRGDCAPPAANAGGWRPAQTIKGPSFKRAAIVEEEEEEEE